MIRSTPGVAMLAALAALSALPGAAQQAQGPRPGAQPEGQTDPGGTLVISARNLVFDVTPEGWRVTDFIQVRNRDAGPLQPASDRDVVLRYPLPAGVAEADVLRGDDSASPPSNPGFVAGGVLHSSGSIPPGESLYVVRYPLSDPYISFELPGVTEVVDVLVREPAPSLEVEGLELMGAASLDDGRPFRHFSAVELSDATVRIFPGARSPDLPAPAPLAALGLTLVLFGTGILVRSGPVSREPAASPTGGRRDLIRSIAEIDEALDEPTLDFVTRSGLEARRKELVRLASRSGREE